MKISESLEETVIVRFKAHHAPRSNYWSIRQATISLVHPSDPSCDPHFNSTIHLEYCPGLNGVFKGRRNHSVSAPRFGLVITTPFDDPYGLAEMLTAEILKNPEIRTDGFVRALYDGRCEIDGLAVVQSLIIMSMQELATTS